MLLADVLRLRLAQHKAGLRCYLVLSLWILLLVGGAYKFLEPRAKPLEASSTAAGDPFVSLSFDVKTRRIFGLCNRPEEIKAGDEGAHFVKK